MLLLNKLFLVELMRKENWNLQLCWLVNIMIVKIPQIYENFARAEGSAHLSQAIHTNPGHNYLHVFFGSTHFSFSHRDTFSGGHQSGRNCVVKTHVKFKQASATQSFPTLPSGLQSNVAAGVTKCFFCAIDPKGIIFVHMNPRAELDTLSFPWWPKSRTSCK